jgi:phosphoribosylformylglycinamidine cyclo-ligase
VTMDYKTAGVDIEAGDALVTWLKANQPSRLPHQERIVSGIGGFAALFRGSFPEMESPCLVSCTDGVGTKVKLAVQYGGYEQVAQDLVAMCVNDMICSGAQPLFFLDYYACGRLNLENAKLFLKGVQNACLQSDCLLIGGETAEMPGVYNPEDFDCAGFSVGVVDEAKVLGAHRVQFGDRVIGVSSSGFHSNGFSLLRRIFEQDLDSWADRLLIPTALYVRLAKELTQIPGIRAYAHVTGGGMDNLLRVVPEASVLSLKTWEVPEPFLEVKRRGKMEWKNLLSTLNCGIGLVVYVSSESEFQAHKLICQHGFKSFSLGTVEEGEAGSASRWTFKESEFTGQL